MRMTQLRPGRIFGFGLIALLAFEVLRIYWIMPFPGSQRSASLGLAYALHQWIWPLRWLFAIPLLLGFASIVRYGSLRARIGAVIGTGLFGFVAYQANGPMSAEHMFRQPNVLDFVAAANATTPAGALIVGVALKDADGTVHARAYPIRFIGYHHQVRDALAGQDILVSYCTVCRTGRVFSPLVEGRLANFRLVGMDHFNALFEDDLTGSWWRQANGQAVAGAKRGSALTGIPSQQMTWAAWQAQHPTTDIMAPDPGFEAQYAGMEGFEDGTRTSALTGRNQASWEEKSWVVGVLAGGGAERAFDWNELVRKRVINDRVGDADVLLVLAADGQSFRAFDARLAGEAETLQLAVTDDPSVFHEVDGDGRWHESGVALEGSRAGQSLMSLPAYQEFWHSWRTFHPETSARRSAK